MSDQQDIVASDDPTGEGPRATLLEISNAIVGLHKRYYGRGPTKAHATLSRDLLVVVLEGGFSQAERTLAESGRPDAVEGSRQVMQGVIKNDWTDAVEGLLRRKVRSFLSASDPVNQIQVESFVLWPDGDGQEAGATPHE